MSRNNVIPQMFDVRPVRKTGGLDWEKIRKVNQVYERKGSKKEMKFSGAERGWKETDPIKIEPKIEPRYVPKYVPRKAEVYVLGQKFESEKFPIFNPLAENFYDTHPKFEELEPEKIIRKEKRTEKKFVERITISEEVVLRKSKIRKNYSKTFRKIKHSLKEKIDNVGYRINLFFQLLNDFFRMIFPQRKRFSFSFASNFVSFSALAMLITLTVGTTAFWNKGMFIQGHVLGASEEGYDSINAALNSLKDQNFEESVAGFGEANLKFSQASEELDKIGNLLIGSSRFIPFVSKLSSGSNMIEAAKNLSLAGQELAKVTQTVARLKGMEKTSDFSLLKIFRDTESNLRSARDYLKKANELMDDVNVADLPEDKREKFVTLKTGLPSAILAVDTFLNNEKILNDLLGGNGPRKYLFLFQNNQEMRATGGFIGSYGLLDISNGRIRNFFIDGIFNPDGQLKEKIVPPLPIQKISAAWSLHDSNWFPDFPASAKEAIVFYEKTGGPTTDGVITLTPTVLQKMLEITGPIEMKEYDVVLDSRNFIEKTQYKVEIDYDKTENKPKKILSDLAPLILDKLFSAQDLKTIVRTLDVFVEALNQKQILIFSQNSEMQKIISEQGWSGEVLQTPKDYLSVINSNINGFKTDGVIDEKITHMAEIQPDGTVIDTVAVTRHHNGGSTGYAWWDSVNADYMRVYVPLGSKFLSVEGQTREFNKSPLDYNTLGFKKNARVEEEESGIKIDENSGTRIYEDFGKTVFANWTYVSPRETMTIKYRYQLPFKVVFDEAGKSAKSYSLLLQKQSGSLGSEVESKIIFPRKYEVIWRSPEDLQLSGNELQFKAVLDRDRFWGAAFTEKNLIINE